MTTAINTTSTEVRMTSATGASKGTKLARFDLIPSGALRQLAEHYGKGAQKYERVDGVDNWRNGYEWGLSIAALARHFNSFMSGEDIDEETQSKHLIAVAWHAFTLVTFMDNPEFCKLYDDRQDTKLVGSARVALAIDPAAEPAVEPAAPVVQFEPEPPMPPTFELPVVEPAF